MAAGGAVVNTVKAVATKGKAGVVDAATGAIGGAIMAGAAAFALKMAPTMKQLNSAIALYMPHDWSERYGADYDKMETPQIVNLLAAQSQGGQAASATAINAIMGGVKMTALNATSEYGDTLRKSARQLFNPNAEQLFKGMDFRKFDFNFDMTPRNKKEADAILNIINTFKYFMHPEKTDDNFLIFPAEFEIEFYSGGNVNQFLGSLSTCALTDMSVNYTPNGLWSALQGTDGYAQSVNLRLQFTEMELLTKNRLDLWKEGPDLGEAPPVKAKPTDNTNTNPAAGGPKP
jgi:hypothetical protein